MIAPLIEAFMTAAALFLAGAFVGYKRGVEIGRMRCNKELEGLIKSMENRPRQDDENL